MPRRPSRLTNAPASQRRAARTNHHAPGKSHAALCLAPPLTHPQVLRPPTPCPVDLVALPCQPAERQHRALCNHFLSACKWWALGRYFSLFAKVGNAGTFQSRLQHVGRVFYRVRGWQGGPDWGQGRGHCFQPGVSSLVVHVQGEAACGGGCENNGDGSRRVSGRGLGVVLTTQLYYLD